MVLEMNVDVFTQSLTKIPLDPARKNRLHLMTELYDQGISTKRLSELFNYLEIPTPRGATNSAKLIWMFIDKRRKGQKRLNDTYSTVIDNDGHTQGAIENRLKKT